MGLFGFGHKKGVEGTRTTTAPAGKAVTKAVPPNFDTWRDPRVETATTEWQRRLDSFAKKSARTLNEAGVPRFRCAWSRDGEGTYSDDFWLVAVDVQGASRSLVGYQPAGGEPADTNQPPQPKPGDFVGHMRGDALMLSKSGVLCGAEIEGWLTRAGGVDSQCMDMIFHNVRRDDLILSGGDGWVWYNSGRWRRDPSRDSKAYGMDLRVQSINFEEKYRRTKEPEPGYNTSAALSGFVKSNGQTRWPRHFTSFEYS